MATVTRQPIPDGLDQMEPGPFLAAILSTINVDSLSGYDRIVVLRAMKRMASHYDGRFLETAASVATACADPDSVDEGWEAAGYEIRAALRVTRRSAETTLSLAAELRDRLPQVGESLVAGTIDVPRARVMVNETSHLNPGTARDVISEVIDRAPQLTTGQLRALIRRLCFEVNPQEASDRYQSAVSDRCLLVDPNEMGTADLLILNSPPDKAAAASDHINYLAKQLRRSGETRTMDQLRADIALDLLIGKPIAAPTRRGTTTLHVDLTTLAELSEKPGELAGYAPVVADIARQVAVEQQDGEWRYRVTHPENGHPIHTGTTRRRPNTSQRRQVELRDTTCVFPGCRMPAQQCDIDHIDTWADTGKTEVKSLAPGCKHDHTGRHDFDWTYQPLPNGDYLWISPLGHSHTTSGRPPP